MKYGEGSGSVRVGDGTCTMVSKADSTWLAPGKPAAYADTPFVGQGRNSPFSIIERSFGAWILSLSPEGSGRIEKAIGIIEGKSTYGVVSTNCSPASHTASNCWQVRSCCLQKDCCKQGEKLPTRQLKVFTPVISITDA